MKKFFFAAVAAVAMVACGGNQAANENANENEACEQECVEATLDIEALEAVLACDNAETINAALTQAQEEVAKLVSVEKSAEAYSLADAVLVAIAKNAENLDAQGVNYAVVAEALEAVKASSEAAVAEAVADAADAEAAAE